ncbi:alpha-L RNA-binding motif-containing protein [Lophiostoma macrostomum CBS 122681]|uniref:Alpha-L RNA-binding motif-containing protein n=1 Tax=Lophiostoma macrostomum CBS 122681 TaxID=1314788 RepID=A0A6A6TI26_9PLEO|nr:alpha-L RNA-binding motif-containing protein [Lophiostoma macrostomum CBS 122681]
MRKKPRFHSLKKLKIRQDWSRWSLYSIARLAQPNTISRTYFQQKWTAKSDTRAYHGEQIREKKWKRLFKRSLPAVVPMDHRYLARHDGSEQAAGRGAGVDEEGKKQTPRMTPYMQMTYYPIERRLDSAIFRSLFASSVRQARQFVVHGLVTVNGKKIPYPGYMLNPGDMFQVDTESVMFATGAQKIRSSVARKIAAEKKAARGDTSGSAPAPREPTIAELISQSTTTSETPSHTSLKTQLQTLMENVEDVLGTEVSAKDKQKFREFRQNVKKAISLWKTASPESVTTLDAQFTFLQDQLAAKRDPSSTQPADTSLSQDDAAKLKKAFERLKQQAEYDAQWNKRDASRPYLTPWRPRDFMSAFAFIPRYLEVNQNICAAVYLRHPVARPGLAEVPTPFPYETGQLAFNWYLRRR